MQYDIQKILLFTINYSIGIYNSNGYVTTLSNPLFSKLKGDIFVMDFNNGVIYNIFNNKYDFIEKITKRQKKTKIIVYYNNIDFSEEELDNFTAMDAIMINKDKKKLLVKNELKRLPKFSNSCGDFIPGYVSTLGNNLIDKILLNIIVIGFENGMIYNIFNNKEDFLEEYKDNRNKYMVYYKNIIFTKEELDKLWNMNIWMCNQTQKKKVADSFNHTISLYS